MDSNLHITGQFEIEETGVTLNDLAPIPAQTVANSSDILDLNQRINDLLYPIGSVVTLSSRYETLSNGVYEEGKNYYTKDDTTGQYTLLVAGTNYTIGDAISTTVYKEITPAETYGGKWELIDKRFKVDYGSDVGTFIPNTTYITKDSSIYVVRKGDTLRIRGNLVTEKDFDDNDIASDKGYFGKIDLKTYGVTNIMFAPNIFAYISDDIIGILAIIHNTGEIRWRGLESSSYTTISSGSTIWFDHVFTMGLSYMLDDACDQFCWKRTE